MADTIAQAVKQIKNTVFLRSLDESATKQSVVLRLLSLCGWDPFDLSQVAPEYTVVLAGLPSVYGIIAAGDAEEVLIDQAIERDNVEVSLHSVRLGETKTWLTYSYRSNAGTHVEPLGLPTIQLPDGSQVESAAGGVVDGSVASASRTVILPEIPAGTKTLSVDLASFIEYTTTSDRLDISSGDLLQGIGVSSVTTPQNAVLDHTFSIGPADYRFTSLTLEPSNFVLTYEPMNIVATKTVLGGGLSTLNMTDDLGGIYSSYLTVAKWSVDNGHKVRVQSLYFEGLPNPDANTFSLHVNGIGEIKAPYRFEVALR